MSMWCAPAVAQIYKKEAEIIHTLESIVLVIYVNGLRPFYLF